MVSPDGWSTEVLALRTLIHSILHTLILARNALGARKKNPGFYYFMGNMGVFFGGLTGKETFSQCINCIQLYVFYSKSRWQKNGWRMILASLDVMTCNSCWHAAIHVGIFECLPFCFTINSFPRKSLFWALVLLVLIVYVFALIFTQSAAWKHQVFGFLVDGVGMSNLYLMYKGKGGYSWMYQYILFFGGVGAIYVGSPFVPIKLVAYPTRQLWSFEIFGIEPGPRSPSLPKSSLKLTVHT